MYSYLCQKSLLLRLFLQSITQLLYVKISQKIFGEFMDGIEVLVLLDVGGLEDKEKFEKHVKKEGFNPVEEEDFVYTGHSTTTTFSTKAYILEVFKKGLQKNKFNDANLIFLLNETPYPTYYYDKETNDFELVQAEK